MYQLQCHVKVTLVVNLISCFALIFHSGAKPCNVLCVMLYVMITILVALCSINY